MTTTELPAGLHCSFCGKHQDDIYKLIAGPGVYICDECVALCQQIIADELSREECASASSAPAATSPTSPTSSTSYRWGT